MNRFLSAGDESQNHLLAGFESIADMDSGGIGARGGAGFGVIPLIERIARGVSGVAAAAAAVSYKRDDGFDWRRRPTFMD